MTSDERSARAPDTIVLIHGLWLTAASWEHWVERYAEQGYHVIARSWPGMEGDIEQLRADPSAITGLGVEDIVVVDTGDAVLVTTKARAQEVKGIVEVLSAGGRTDLL
jgi:pimeloyl-ACP methyl ester carboxylesterase